MARNIYISAPGSNPKPLFDPNEPPEKEPKPIFDAGTFEPLSDEEQIKRLEEMSRRGVQTLPSGATSSVSKVPGGYQLSMRGAPKPPDDGYEDGPEPSTGEQIARTMFDDSGDIMPELVRQMVRRRDEAKRQQTMAPLPPKPPPPSGPLEPIVDPGGDVDKEGTAASFKNPSIYKGLEGQAYQDAAQADFDNYFNNPESSGVITHSEYTDDRVGTVHVFEREDGVDVKFAETPDGNLYNVTDVI